MLKASSSLQEYVRDWHGDDRLRRSGNKKTEKCREKVTSTLKASSSLPAENSLAKV
ncbi:MAG: hypothetical protein II670_01790 [Alphaproteobacteria bacterium]|nr:hypothetical protein [Alphaproteobacteria bacterium]